MMIDTHAHLNFNAYKDDADEVIRRSLDAGMEIINVGSNYATSKRAVEMAEKYERGIYASIGLHPIHLETGLVKIKPDKSESILTGEEIHPHTTTRTDPEVNSEGTGSSFGVGVQFKTTEEFFDYDKYKRLAESSKKVVAMGEIGLDYYYRPKTKTKLEEFKQKQKKVFSEQLNLAVELDLPVIFHCRMAHDDLLEILNSRFKIHDSRFRGVVHCFTGNWEQAQKYMEMGFSLGFNGIIFKMDLDDIIKKAPLDKILAETDCPYLTPSPMEGRNEPLNVKYVAEKIAELKNLDVKQVPDITTKNAKELFL